VHALPSSGKRGTVADLRYRVRDNRGRTRETIWVLDQSGRQIWRRTTRFGPATGTIWAVRYKIPKSLKTARFCVRSTDPAGNKSGTSCASLRILGPVDQCPDVPSGRFDYNHNGCPGPFDQIGPQFNTSGSRTSEGRTKYSFVINELPPGTRVTIEIEGDAEHLTAGRSGIVKSRLLESRFFEAGTRFTIESTKAGWIGNLRRLRTTVSGRGYAVVENLCIPVGSKDVVPCGRVDRGR
jgi:hypothetical protein